MQLPIAIKQAADRFVVCLVLLLLFTLVLSGCSQEAPPAAQMPPPAVGVYTVSSTPLTLTEDLPGRTAPYRKAEVRPQVDGIVEKRLFTEGRFVEAGQQLYQIDDATYRAAHQRALASLNNARRLADRYRALQKTSAVSRQQLDDAIAALDLAEAEAEISRISLAYTKVLAPIAGRIGRSAVSEGALVSNGQSEALATIQQLDPIYVDISQPVIRMQQLRAAATKNGAEVLGEQAAASVELLFEDGSLYPLKGTLQFSEVSVEPDTGSVILRAEFPNPRGELLPGMFVKARLKTLHLENALLVPQQGVQRDLHGNPTALVVNTNDQVESRTLITERTVGNQWLVSSGLKPGDRVVTEGLFMLRPGMQVTVTPASNIRTDSDLTDVDSTVGSDAPDAGAASTGSAENK